MSSRHHSVDAYKENEGSNCLSWSLEQEGLRHLLDQK